MSEIFNNLVGNPKLKSTLGNDITNGKIRHAYIFDAPKGSGKHTAAMIAASALLCENGSACGKCAPCRKIAEHVSPDISYINKNNRASIGVDAIRSIRSDIFISPVESEYKIYIIEEANLMTVQAQNSFLLALEEPPPYIVYFLLCDDSTSLLETIRSRAPIIRFEPIEPNLIRDYIIKNSKKAKALDKSNPTELMSLIMASDGRIGEAKRLIEATQKQSTAIIDSRNLALNLVKSHGTTDIYSVYSQLPSKRDEAIAIIDISMLVIRDLIMAKSIEEDVNLPLSFFTDKATANKEAANFTVKELIDMASAFKSASVKIMQNVPIRLSLYGT